MNWLSGVREKARRRRAWVIANNLQETLVNERSGDNLSEMFDIAPPLVEKFREKVTRYREAVVLMCLIAEATTDKEFAPIQTEYEAILFGPRPTPEGLRKLPVLKYAMADMGRLIHPKDKPREFEWAMTWFAEIGHMEFNPATNLLLAKMWMDEYVGTAHAVKECLNVHFAGRPAHL